MSTSKIVADITEHAMDLYALDSTLYWEQVRLQEIDDRLGDTLREGEAGEATLSPLDRATTHLRAARGALVTAIGELTTYMGDITSVDTDETLEGRGIGYGVDVLCREYIAAEQTTAEQTTRLSALLLKATHRQFINGGRWRKEATQLYYPAVSKLLHASSPAQRRELLLSIHDLSGGGILEASAQSKNTADGFMHYIANTSELRDIALEACGVQGRGVSEAWDIGYDTTRRPDRLPFDRYRSLSLSTMLYLERQRPGSVRMLRDVFGLRNFGRYAPEMLRQMVDDAGDSESPYGVIVYPVSDHNGATCDVSHNVSRVAHRMKEDMGRNLRIYEVGNQNELLVMANRLRRQYGPGKAEFCLMRPHGAVWGVQLGGPAGSKDPQHFVKVHDISKLAGKEAPFAFLHERALILFASCSTEGEMTSEGERNLVQTVKAISGRRSRGPARTFILDRISVEEKNGMADVSLYGRYDEDDT